MAINLRNNVTWTGLNLVTNPILKSSATNPVNIWVKTPVNQYKTEDPRYANKTQVNTQVKTPVLTQQNQYMSVNPKYQTNQTTVPVQTNTNQSRFIWFQNNNLWVQSKFTQDMQNITQGKTNLTDLIKARTENNKNKQYLEIPTQAKAIKQYNQDQEQKYRTNEKAIEDFHYDVLKFNWKMTADQISQYYPEFKGKENQALELQKALLPYVLDNEFASMEAITQNFPDLLPAKQQANTTEDEAKATAKKIDSENKKHFDRIKNINQNTLSYNGKEFANFMIELSNVPYQIKKNYKVDSAVTDEEIIAYVLNNFPEYKEEYERIQNLQLSDQDKARLWIWGNWLNKFSVWVANAVNAANNWYQNNVQKTLSDVPIVGSIANIPWGVIGWFNKMLQAWWELTNWEFESAWQIASSWIKAIWGWVESVFNTALAPITAAFNVAWETELWKQVEENTLWLAQDWITAFYEKTPIIKNFYNSLDDEAKADLVNETMLALFHWLGKWIKKTWLDVKAWVATDAITNALQRWKYASKFQIWVEKWLADENGKFSDWALKRIVWEWTKEVESALKENFSRFNEVVEARKQARDFKQAPADNTNLEDQRSTTEKVKSEIKNTAEAVKNKVSEVNDVIKEKYTNLISNKKWTQVKWVQQFESTSENNKWLNQPNYTQGNNEIKTKTLLKPQVEFLQTNNRMNPKAIQTFEEKFWESYWQYMYDKWFTKKWESNLEDMATYQKDLMQIKEDALNKIEWKFHDVAVSDMLEVLQDFYTKTKDRKNLTMVENYINQHNNGWLSMPEINKVRKKFQYDIRTNFFKDWNSEKIQLANNVYLAVKDFLDKTAKENWLDSLDEINREIMKVQHIIWWITYKLRWSSANNMLWLTDWISLASMVNNPQAIALFLWKQLAKKERFMNPILKIAVWWRWNAKNRITAEKMQWQLNNIAKINDEKARNTELEKFYNTYIKPVKELSEYFDNSVAEFKKQFNEMVEEWTLNNALPDLREEDVKSGKKNLVTSKNQVTIEVDEKGNARRKGQISESDKRSEDNKKGWYDNKPTEPTEPTEPKKPAPTQPKNSVTSKKEEKTNTSEEREQKTEKTAHEKKEEPKKENSDLKDAVWDDYYNWLERQLEIINDSRKWNKEPLTLDDIDIGSNIYLAKFEKLHKEKLKSLQQELSDLNINQADTKLTPKQQKMLEQAKSEEERQWLLEKWRREYLEKNQMSDEDIAKVEKIMNKVHELVEQREKYYNYILDWTEKKNAKDKVINTKNAITSKKQETATEFMDRLERENAEDIKAQQSDLFNMPETEDIEAIDNELTARQQEDLKNMPETEDVEAMDANKTWLAEKLNNTAIDTNSSDFKEWFWDYEKDPKNASKVVDKEWKPMMVYHGTPRKEYINVFDKNRAWKTQSADFKWIFFTDEKWIADVFSHEQLPWSSSFWVKLWEKGRVYSSYLNMRNPLDFNQKITKEFAEELYNYRKIEPQYWWWVLDYYPWAEWKEKFINQVMKSHPQSIKFLLDMNKVEEAWYDWYIAKMYWWDTPWNEYVVWDGNQIITDNTEAIEKPKNTDDIEALDNRKDIVSEYKEKTNEMYQSIDWETPAEVEAEARDYIIDRLNDVWIYDDDAIVDLAVTWSRSRWLARPDSDLDIVVEINDDLWMREDDLFDILNEDSSENGRLRINWIDVDINPIIKSKTWTLDYFLEKAEKYLSDKKDKQDTKNTLNSVTWGNNAVTAKQTDIKPKNLVTEKTKQETVVEKIIRESDWAELKYDEDINWDNKTISFTTNWKDYTYSITNSDLKELFNRGRLEIPDEKAEKQAKIDKEIEQNIKAFENEKPKNLVTNQRKEEITTTPKQSLKDIQEIDKDTYRENIIRNSKDHPREMFIYKDWNYYYPSYILPSWKILTPENTYWWEVSSEEAARNWLQKKAEEHSVENETKKTERLKNIAWKTAEKYEETLKRIESDNPMQEIRTRWDYFKYGTSNSQMAKAKKEADANAEVWTFKKDVIDWKEWYRIFVSWSKQDAIRAFYEPKTWKAYRIYRWPTISDAKPFTTREVDRIEKFLWNVEKQLEKETKKEKVEKKDVITQEWLDSIKPDKDWVIELEPKSNELYALRQWKESLVKEWKADGKYLQNYWWEKYPQYIAVYIKDWNVYEWRRWLEDQFMKTKQEAVDWLNQKEKDVEHEATARYTQTDYEPLPKTISVESEAEKAWPKRIAPDRVKWQQETYDKWLNNVKDVLKASPLKLYELWFKSDRSKAVQDIMSERKRIRELPEEIAEKQWNELAKSVYEPLVIKDISKWYRYPEDVTSKFPKAQMQKAIDARARYEKWLFTSFSNKDTRANNQYRDEIWAWIKSQDWKPVTQEQMNEIVDGIRSFGGVFWLDMKKFAEDNNIIYVHLHGWNPFLMWGWWKSKWWWMNIAWLYRRWSDWNISISLWWVELVMEKWEDWEMKKNNVNATPEHELAHAFDYMLDNKLFSSQDIEILKKTMNKPTRLIKYYNKSQEIVARAVEQYAAKKTWKSRYGRPYKDSQAYWNEENFEKYVKPIVEKNMNEKLKEYKLDNSKKNVISNDKNRVTSK